MKPALDARLGSGPPWGDRRAPGGLILGRGLVCQAPKVGWGLPPYHLSP